MSGNAMPKWPPIRFGAYALEPAGISTTIAAARKAIIVRALEVRRICGSSSQTMFTMSIGDRREDHANFSNR